MANIPDNDLAAELQKLISSIAEIEPEKVTMEANFVEDLGMDSMMALEILATLEKKYKLKIPEQNLTKMTNLREVIAIVKEYMK